jgi:DNA primase
LSNTFVDFKEIKDRVSIEALLGYYNIKLRRVNQQSMRGNCPLPMHSSEKSKESFIIQTGKNIWTCQSSSCVAGRSGKKGGNILDFVALMENCSIRDAAVKLRDWFLVTKHNSEPQKGSDPIPERNPKTDDEGDNKPLTFTLHGIDCAHQYLQERGITAEIAEHFCIGFFPGKGSMSGRVVIPIHNERGELIAYAGRAIDKTEPKYKLPAGFKKSEVLFNLHRRDASDNTVIIVEGFFDSVKVHQAGFPEVVALMGSSLSVRQEELLRKCSDVVILLDGDAAGRDAAREIAARLVRSHWVRVIELDDGIQPDQLSSEEIQNLINPIFE